MLPLHVQKSRIDQLTCKNIHAKRVIPDLFELANRVTLHQKPCETQCGNVLSPRSHSLYPAVLQFREGMSGFRETCRGQQLVSQEGVDEALCFHNTGIPVVIEGKSNHYLNSQSQLGY